MPNKVDSESELQKSELPPEVNLRLLAHRSMSELSGCQAQTLRIHLQISTVLDKITPWVWNILWLFEGQGSVLRLACRPFTGICIPRTKAITVIHEIPQLGCGKPANGCIPLFWVCVELRTLVVIGHLARLSRQVADGGGCRAGSKPARVGVQVLDCRWASAGDAGPGCPLLWALLAFAHK